MRYLVNTRVSPVIVGRLARLWAISAAAMLLVLGGMSAQAAWSQATAAPAPVAAPRLARAVAVTGGATGTTALPSVPVTARYEAADDGDPVARPFSLAAADPDDRARALSCLAAAIYYEAASEPVAGQQAVAQVVLNRVRHPAFPHSVCGVVYQRSARGGCQFSFACDGATARVPAGTAWMRALAVAGRALSGQVFAGVGLATHYHSRAVSPDWGRTLMLTDVIGAHLFHRWRGWWGSPAAFDAAYAGAEPGANALAAAPAGVRTAAAAGRVVVGPELTITPDQLDEGPIGEAVVGPGAADDAAPQPLAIG